MTKTQMTPVRITRQHQTYRRVNDPTSGTRKETWEAETTDGQWRFERIEDTGTPWLAIHIPTDSIVGMFGSLPKCRRAAASGILARLLEDNR